MNVQEQGRRWRWLNLVALLSLVLVLLPTPARAQQEPVEQVVPAAQLEETAVQLPPAEAPVGEQPIEAAAQQQPATAPEEPAAPLGPEAPADNAPGPWAVCTNSSRPASAWNFSIARDDEYGVLWKRGDGEYNLWSLYGQDRTTLAVSTLKDHGVIDTYSTWMHGTAVDFNGDSTDEMFTAYKNGIGQLTAHSVINPTAATPTIDTWNSNAAISSDPYIDVAAGNLRGTTDGKKSVVIAYKNASGGLQMAILDGDSTGGILQANGSYPTFVNTDQGRGTVWYVAVATGDLDGDGVDNEIVTAFKDANLHLQILVTRLALVGGAWTWQKLDEFRYESSDAAIGHYADEPGVQGDYSKNPVFAIDVTTGDVDGDAVDEAIVGFADRGNWLQTVVMRLRVSGTTPELAEAGFLRLPVDTKTPRFVAVAAPDLNFDGVAEITTAWSSQWKCDGCCVCYGHYAARFWRMHFQLNDASGTGTIAYDYQYTDDHNGYNVPEYLKIEAADVDRDLRQEVVFSWMGVKNGSGDPNDYLPVELIKEYHGEPLPAGMATPVVGTAYLVNRQWNDSHLGYAHDVSVIVGDFDNDSELLKYTGECYQYGDATINTVVSLPPFWYDYNAGGVGAGYGVSVSRDEDTGTTGKVTLGGSAKIDLSTDILGFEAGPTFEASVEASCAISKNESREAGTALRTGTSFEPSGSAFGFVVHDAVDYKVYKYTESEHNAPTWLRVASVSSQKADVTEKWNSYWSYNGWLPVGLGPRVNLAEKLAQARYTQSSTFGVAAASRAGDGNVDGVYTNGSVSHTNSEAGAWWQVDLTGNTTEQPIESVSIWNRTDMYTDRTKDYVVEVYDGDHNLKWTSATQTARAGRPTNVPVGRSGRYVRVALTGTNYLVLAEVQVWKENRVNLALGLPATSYRQSSTFTGGGIVGEAWRAGDGNTDGTYSHGSVTHTTNRPAHSWWQVDLGSRQFIGSVDIWNRTDGSTDRLRNYTVKVYDTTTDPNCGAVNAGDTDRWESPLFTTPAGTPSWVRVQRMGRYVCIQLKGADATDGAYYFNYLHMAEVQVWKARQVPDFPKAVTKITDDGTHFLVTNQDNSTQKAAGQLLWDWCQGYLGDPNDNIEVAARNAVELYSGAASEDWNMSTATGQSTSWEKTFGATLSMGFEAKAGGVGVETSFSAGFEGGFSRTIGWNKETYYEGSVQTLTDEVSDHRADYKYCPYLYLATATGNNDVPQQYLVLDYYVPCYGTACEFNRAVPAAAQQPAAPPATPLIDSPTHPDPNAWSPENTATFTWQQPDASTGLLYRWFLDRAPDTVPEGPAQGARQTETYYGLADGTWYLHVRAMNAQGEWSETAHRRIRIDQRPPEVTLTLDPPISTGNQGWYTTPVTVTATVEETGSGVATIETSTDEGATWQPYTEPLRYTADTPPTTIWARATDVAVHASEPVSTSLKIDLTPPDSHAVGTGCVWGICYADIRVDAQGNEHLVLMGQIHEDTSGAGGMEIQANGGRWTGVGAIGEWHPFPERPAVTVNWVYTATLDIGHGYHMFKGRAVDGAGHAEEPYDIAQFIWYPLSSPDLGGSTIAIEPAVTRPGDTVEVLMAVRNGGRQEAQVDFKATLPAGLTPVEDTYRTVDNSIVYDAAANALSWPTALLWPGETRYARIQAVVNGSAAGALKAVLDAHAYWPNTDLLPPDLAKEFWDRESVVATSANLTVDPELPAQRDVTAPRVQLQVVEDEGTGDSLELRLSADADARWLYVREWTLDPASGAWVVARNSGWIDYSPSLTWALSNVPGVHYVGAWVADGAWNVSRLSEDNLDFANRLGEDTLLAGQRRQYRFNLGDGLAVFNLLAYAGQADLYAWRPQLGQYPTYVGAGDATLKTLWFGVERPGLHLFEIVAAQDGAYSLLPVAGSEAMASAVASAPGGSESVAALPNHPLSMSTPLMAGLGAAPELDFKRTYLPITMR